MSNPPRLTVLTTTRSVPGSAWQVLSGTVRRWAADSQRTACRNAMVAGTALAARRVEREEVEEYLASRTAAHVPHPHATTGTAPVPTTVPTTGTAAGTGDGTAHA